MADAMFVGVDRFGVALARIVLAADAAGERIVTLGGHAIERAAKAHQDGRPGPERITGNLARSTRLLDVQRLGTAGWKSWTGPTAVYGRRIELGFFGADSLGREYNQPAYPFLEPGVEDAMPTLSAIYRAQWAKALRV